MSRTQTAVVFAVFFLTRAADADHNHDVAIQYCDWIESAVARLNDAAPDSQRSWPEWERGQRFLNRVKEYQALTGFATWVSKKNEHTAEARFVGLTSDSVELVSREDTRIRVQLLRLDRQSRMRIRAIEQLQQELVLDAYAIYIFTIDVEDPDDLRWKFLVPLPKEPPDLLLRNVQIDIQDWRTHSGNSFRGVMRRKLPSDDTIHYEFRLEDGHTATIPEADLTEASIQNANAQLKHIRKLAGHAAVQRYEEYFSQFNHAKAFVEALQNEVPWKLSPEYRMSRTALAETKRWISSQTSADRTSYELALKLLLHVGDIYRGKHAERLKNILDNPQLDELFGPGRGGPDAKTWKADVEDLLRHSSAGKIYVRDADGAGIHLKLGTVWQKSAEVAFND